MVLFLVSFISSNNAFSTVSTLIGTLIGFLTGVYVPIGQLPPTVQTVIQLIPTSHAAALFRQVLMEKPLAVTFAGAPANAAESFKEVMGVNLTMGGHTFTAAEHLLILAAAAVLFSLLSLWSLSRKKK
jgi:multidrug/hemolysin transport system permease protein